MKMRQTATYWPKGVRNGFGQIDYPASKTIKVRWEDKQKLFIDNSGEEALSRAVVYAGIEIDDEGYLYLGESTEADPTNEQKAFKVKSVSVTPNLRNTKQEVKVWL